MATVGEAYERLCQEYSQLAHIANPREKAALALDIVGGYSREGLALRRGEELPADVERRLIAAACEAKLGVPLAYALGEWYFAGRRFRIPRGVLIPRPDTETLALFAVKHAAKLPSGMRILEIGVGSGSAIVSIACDLANKTPFCAGTDVSAEAIAAAKVNAQAHGIELELRQGNLLEPFSLGERFDIIISNPPYIPENEEVEESVRLYEPEIAYRVPAGARGTHFHALIASSAGPRLNAGGLLAMEVGSGQAGEAAQILALAGFADVTITKDLSGTGRVVGGLWQR